MNLDSFKELPFLFIFFSTYVSDLHASSPGQLFKYAEAISLLQSVSGSEVFTESCNNLSPIRDSSFPSGLNINH